MWRPTCCTFATRIGELIHGVNERVAVLGMAVLGELVRTGQLPQDTSCNTLSAAP
jgi:hypothetical protein